MELILTVCSVVNPAHCDDRHLQFATQESLRQCVANAQPYMAQWINAHPNLRVVKWRCAYPGNTQQGL